jgi:hypothetical protein
MSNVVRYSVDVADFSIDFEVDIDASISCTRSFKVPTVDDYIFSCAEIRMRCGNERYLVCGADEVYNLEVTLISLIKAISGPKSIEGIENIIEQGGLSKWMRGYWSRIYADCATEEDESIYDKLFPACEVSHRYGYIAVYRYKGLPVIEVTGQTSLEETPFVKAAVFNAGLLADEIAHIRTTIRNAIQQRMSAH